MRAASTAPPVEAIEVVFDPSSTVDVTEKKLVGTTFALTSSIFGFPNFRSLIDLRGDGTVYFWGGMVSKAVGGWSVEEGDPAEGERPDDLYLQFTQPLTDRYATIFTVPGKTCFWRGKLEFRGGGKTKETVHVEGGQVCSERDGKDLIREGVFTAVSVDEEGALEVQKKSAEAFERALTTPKAESSGFKTPARIAGLNTRRPGRQLTAGKKDDVELEDD